MGRIRFKDWSWKTMLFRAGLLHMLLFVELCWAWGGERKIKLREVQSLTLQQGEMTTGRRSRPVPQLRCVGRGSAGCEFVPKVVQCYNRGSNEYNIIQWECKADMDNDYRFGAITVSCEGYDYPDDPYVLSGSCGLEYTIDFTNEGKKHQHQHQGQGLLNPNIPNIKKEKNHESNDRGEIIFIILAPLGIVGFGACIFFLVIYIPLKNDEAGDRTNNTTITYQRLGPDLPPPRPPPTCRPNYHPTGVSGYGSSSGGDSCGNKTCKTAANDRAADQRSFSNNTNDDCHSHGACSSSLPPPPALPTTGSRTTSGFGGTSRR